jgi:hypothetical protein
MKGIIFNLLEQVVREEYGDAAWDGLLDATGLDGAYSSLGNYPDEHVDRLVAAASTALGRPPNDIIRWFGQKALPLLALRYPQFFRGHDSVLTFLLTLNDTIHWEVRKIYPGAQVPVFTFDTTTAGVLVMEYQSSRQLCALAHGFMEAAVAHFGEEIEVTQPLCRLRGDTRCEFRVARAAAST